MLDRSFKTGFQVKNPAVRHRKSSEVLQQKNVKIRSDWGVVVGREILDTGEGNYLWFSYLTACYDYL